MGCTGSKYGRDAIDYRHPTPIPVFYPPARPPDSKKRDVYTKERMAKIDEDARTVPAELMKRYRSLLNYLTKNCLDDISKARSIFVWLSTIDLRVPHIKPTKFPDTPSGYVTYMASGQGDLPTFYALLCRRVNIPCVIIDGYGKGAMYEAGDSEKELNEMRNRWNAVYVDGCWRLVHVYWGIIGLTDRDNANPKANPGSSMVKQVNDYFFLTDPEELITRCLPDEREWQLLKKPISWRQFASLPYYRPPFFNMGLKLTSSKSGTIQSEEHPVLVEISTPKSLVNDVVFSFNLYEKKRGDEATDLASLRDGRSYIPPQMDRYVLMQRRDSSVAFRVYLPDLGVYLFELLCGTTGTKSSEVKCLICQFCLVCTKAPNFSEPLPDTPAIGWGPGFECKRYGIIPKHYKDGIIIVNPGEHKTVKFHIDKEIHLQTKLIHNYIPASDLQEYSSHVIDLPKKEARVLASVPEEGLFALKIFIKHENTGDLENICNYLLRPHRLGKSPEKIRNRMLRARLEQAIEEGSEKYLRTAMELFLCYAVPDSGEIKRADDKFRFFQLQRDLSSACKRRNIRVLRKVISVARKSHFEEDLRFNIKHAEGELRELENMKGYLHPIMTMSSRTFSEIHSYCRPQPLIHAVMRATYTLLGESQDSLVHWSRIQGIMARGGKNSLLKQVLDLHADTIPRGTVREADVILETLDLQRIRDVSIGAAAFYIWARGVIDERKQEQSINPPQTGSQCQKMGEVVGQKKQNKITPRSIGANKGMLEEKLLRKL